jgi:hypothetical protein
MLKPRAARSEGSITRAGRRLVRDILFFVLLVEIAVLVWLLLRGATGEEWPLSSLAISFALVALTRPRLERWIWPETSYEARAVDRW